MEGLLSSNGGECGPCAYTNLYRATHCCSGWMPTLMHGRVQYSQRMKLTDVDNGDIY